MCSYYICRLSSYVWTITKHSSNKYFALTRVTCRGHNSFQKMLLRHVALVSELIQTT